MCAYFSGIFSSSEGNSGNKQVVTHAEHTRGWCMLWREVECNRDTGRQRWVGADEVSR